MKLTADAFDRACAFIGTRARPLERTLLDYRFHDGAIERVIEELAAYQNLDGGFGYALEPDVRTPDSSALATAIGLGVLRELACPADHPMVEDAISYLLRSHDLTSHVWRAVPENANEFPHAPWWHDEAGSLEELFDGFRVIPRISILASLYHYREIVPDEWLDDLGERTIEDIEALPVLGTGGGSDLEYAVDWAGVIGLSDALRDRVTARILRDFRDVVVTDETRWAEYCLTPLRAVAAPDALGADLIQDALDAHLDYTIETQAEDGSWMPTWSWGDVYPESWEDARREWQGILTLQNLTSLRAFKRLET